jgi:hypothetical protein
MSADRLFGGCLSAKVGGVVSNRESYIKLHLEPEYDLAGPTIDARV